ncbi:MAG: hypothetical protein J6U87_05350, partial [Clostridia bacterium]|nr:hypothetical protein [Clostridia bacterium]
MTLGEIKAEAMRLMHVDMDIDGESVAELSGNENYGGLYSGIVGALNRAFADLEARRILPLRLAVLNSPTVVGRRAHFSLEAVKDLFAPLRLSVECSRYYDKDSHTYLYRTGEYDKNVTYELLYFDDDHPYLYRAGSVTVEDYDKDAVYSLYYFPSVTRVSHVTPNGTEV